MVDQVFLSLFEQADDASNIVFVKVGHRRRGKLSKITMRKLPCQVDSWKVEFPV